jgi:hypothetical protein
MSSQGRLAGGGPWQAGPVDELDDLVGSWLAVPEVAERLGTDVGRVRRMLQDRDLIAARRGDLRAPQVPASLVDGGRPLPDLRGTLIVLADAGYSDEEALRWLYTPEDSLPGTPVEALRAGRRAEVRRRAQAMGF